MSWMFDGVGRFLAHYLEKPVQGYEPFTPTDPEALRATLQPGDVLLVEGNNHISGVIKYLTQSTWSHAALYVGPIGDRVTADGEPLVLVEANIGRGVVAVPLSKYARFHTRICRPTRLDDEDRARVCAYATERIGFDYDLKNVIDLMRYLFPMPVPQRWRRRMRSRWPNARYVENFAATAATARRIFDPALWRKDQPLRVVLIGTDFEVRVWEKLLDIPMGQLTTYSDLAAKAGSPKAARAVGAAVGKNPICFVVPCHRVIGKDGDITGYHWGITRKRAMIICFNLTALAG